MKDFPLYDFTIRREIAPFAGLRIIRDVHMTETVEDWSAVRSPGRARRRRKLGHRQNIVHRVVPKKEAVRIGDALVMHPEVADALDRLMQEQATKIHDRMLKEVMGEGLGTAMSKTTVSGSGALTMEHLTAWRKRL